MNELAKNGISRGEDLQRIGLRFQFCLLHLLSLGSPSHYGIKGWWVSIGIYVSASACSSGSSCLQEGTRCAKPKRQRFATKHTILKRKICLCGILHFCDETTIKFERTKAWQYRLNNLSGLHHDKKKADEGNIANHTQNITKVHQN